MAKRFAKWLTVICIVCCMAMVFAFTGCKTESARKALTSVTINDAGHLIATYEDETTEDLGLVKGLDGAKGEKGDKGDPGVDGTNGTNGVSIVNAEVNADGKLIITYEDGTTKEAGTVKGDKGDTGAAGAKGDKGDKGDTGAAGKDGRGISKIETIVKDGKTYLKVTYNDNTASDEIEIPTAGTTTTCDHDLEKAQSYVLEPHADKKQGRVLHVWNACGHSEIVAPEHKYGAPTSKAPTCEAAGYENARVCTVCGYYEDGTVVSALGHHMSEEASYLVEEGKFLCTDGGYAIKVCDRKWEITKAEYDALADDLKTTAVEGETTTYYRLCNHAETTKIEATGCMANEWIVTQPTEAADGLATGKCIICGKNTAKVVLPKLTAGNLETVYTLKGEKAPVVCLEERTDNYTYTIPAKSVEIAGVKYETEAKELDIVHKIAAQFHIAVDANGGEHSIDVGVGKSHKWSEVKAYGLMLFAGVVESEIACNNEEQNAMFICKNCNQPVKVVVTGEHKKPAAEDTTTLTKGEVDSDTTFAELPATLAENTVYVTPAACEVNASEDWNCTDCHKKQHVEFKDSALEHEVEYTYYAETKDGKVTWYYDAECTRCNKKIATKAAIYGEPVEIKDESVAATCYAEGTKVFKIYRTEADFKADKFIKQSTKVGKLNHSIIQKDENGNPVIIFEHKELSKYYEWDDEITTELGFSLFADVLKSQCGKVAEGAMFICTYCNQPVRVNVQRSHTKPSTVVTEITKEAYEALTKSEEGYAGKVYSYPASCKDTGYDGLVAGYYCTVCHTLHEDWVEAPAHKVVTRTEVVDGVAQWWTVCSVCGDKITEPTAVYKIVKEMLVRENSCEVYYKTYIYVAESDFSAKKPNSIVEEDAGFEVHQLNGVNMWTYEYDENTKSFKLDDDGKQIVKKYPISTTGLMKFAGEPAGCNSEELVQGVFFCEKCSTKEVPSPVKVYIREDHEMPNVAEADYESVDSVPATGEGLTKGKVYIFKSTDCTVASKIFYLCNREGCDGFEVKTIKEAQTAHEYKYEITTEPTADLTGVLTVTCAHDGCEYDTTVELPKLVDANCGKDKFYTKAVTQKANCMQAMVTTYTFTLTDDGYTYTGKIEVVGEKAGHAINESKPTYTWEVVEKVDGKDVTFIYTAKYCTACKNYVFLNKTQKAA